MENKKLVDDYWKAFLRETGRNMDIEYSDCYYFGMDEQLANNLLATIFNDAQISVLKLIWVSIFIFVPR